MEINPHTFSQVNAMASHVCIVDDPFCGTFGELCEHCEEEMQHRRRIELVRARNEGMREASSVVLEASPKELLMGVGVVGLGAALIMGLDYFLGRKK